MPQILADRLGLPNAIIHLKQGDTDLIPMGGGHGSSRATYMGGTAIWRASDIIIAKGKAVAAQALEAAEADIVFEDGDLPRGRHRQDDHAAGAAAQARDINDSLDTYHQWTREAMTFPNGTHIAEVEVDPETGSVTPGTPDRRGRLWHYREPDDRRRARRTAPSPRAPARRCWNTPCMIRNPANRSAAASWTMPCRGRATCPVSI